MAKWLAKCIMCGKEHKLKGKKPPKGAKFLCPPCMGKVEEELNKRVN